MAEIDVMHVRTTDCEHLWVIGAGSNVPTNACFNKRPDAPHDAGTNCGFIVGDFYIFESLPTLTGIVYLTKL